MTLPYNSENVTDTENPSQSPCPPFGPETTSPPNPPTSTAPSTPTVPSPSSPSKSTSPPSSALVVPLDLIDVPDPSGGRLEPDPSTIARLADTIAQIGLINPITVKPNGNRYTLVAGRRRFAAIQKLGWLTVPIRPLELSDTGAARVCAAENIARSNLSPVEEAVLLQPLVENDPNGIDGAAAALGRTREWIDSRLELLTWPESLAVAIHDRKISMTAAKLLARIPDDALREQRIRDATLHGINARTASLWLQLAMNPEPTQSEMSLNLSPNPQPQISTKTFVVCVRCEKSLEIELTRPTRICHQCLSQLAPNFPQPPDPEPLPTPPELPPTHDHP